MLEPILNVSDPRAGYLALRTEIDAAIHEVLQAPSYILGPFVERFEAEMAAYVGMPHGIGVNNGTDAIHLALRGLGVGPGDEVITVSHTAVATVAGVRMAGAAPVLVDVDPATYTVSVEAARRAITPRTKAIVAVHLYGHPAPVEALVDLCAEQGLFLVEDCAQAHGATYKGGMVGSFGAVSTFSFYPTKNLGAIGDAGMVLARDPEVARRIRLLRQYGWETPQHSLLEGWNSRMDPLQAAILSVKLRHLTAQIERRRALAFRYVQLLSGLPVTLPAEEEGCRHAYHLFVVRLVDRRTRDELREQLRLIGVNAGIHYPFPVHLQQAYTGSLRTTGLPVSEAAAATVLSLPLYPEMADTDVDRVSSGVAAYFAQRP
ncbi:MAG: DegT/DnrJ/EryC1/StrS family aminotransferase [Flavobacteriales bacterium]